MNHFPKRIVVPNPTVALAFPHGFWQVLLWQYAEEELASDTRFGKRAQRVVDQSSES